MDKNDSKKLKRSESFYDQENRKMEDVLTQDVESSVADKRKISLSESSILATTESASGINKKPRKFKPKKFIAKHFKTSSKKELKTDDGIETPDSDLRSSSPAGSSTGTIVEKLKSPKIQVNKIKGNLMKTFSIKKKHKVGPELKSVDIEDDTESNIKRMAGLSVSETSLCEIEDASVTSQKSHDDVLHQEITEKPQNEEADNQQKQSELPKKSQLKITISGKVSNKVSSVASPQTQSISLQQAELTNEPIMNENQETMTSSNKPADEKTEMENIKPISSGGEYVGDGNERPVILETIEKKEEGNKRKSIDEKILEAIRESENNLQKLLSTSAIHKTTSTSLKKTQETKKLNVTKGSGVSESVEEKTSEKIFEKTKSIEKETLKEPKVKESSGFMKKFEKKSKKENSKNKKDSNDNKNVTKEGTTVRVQEARKPYHVNFKSSGSTDELKEKENEKIVKIEPPKSESPTVEISSDDIKFNIGTLVRPLRTSSSNAQPPIRDILSIESSENLSREGSIDANSQHSPKSEKSDKSGGSSYRRKIAYVPQLTVYTPEEQELLKVSMGDSFDLKSPPIEDDSLFPFPNCEAPMDTMTTTSPEKREHLYKILVIGELGTGKTSFIKRYVHQFFSQNYRATIGVDFALKVLNWDQNTTVRLQLWDIAGQERFGNMTRVYYKEAVGAFIVFDVTRSATFDAVIKWKQDLDSKVQLPDGSPIPCILLANKCDQQKQGIVTTPGKLDEYCRENNFAGWFETSAKDNINIEDAAKALVNKILINDKLINSGEIFDNEKFALNGKDDRSGSKKFCSC